MWTPSSAAAPAWIALLALLGGCAPDGTGLCEDALGIRCLEQVTSAADFERIARPVNATLATGYMLPASAQGDLLPRVFHNSQRYRYHVDFLKDVFGEQFGGLTAEGYLALICRRETRRYFAGAIQRFDDVTLGRLYGFTVWIDDRDPGQLLELDELRHIYAAIHDGFVPEQLIYVPVDPLSAERARSWSEPGFPIYLP